MGHFKRPTASLLEGRGSTSQSLLALTGGMPTVLADVADMAGQDAALALALAYGGTEIYWPKPDSIGPDHDLAKVLGQDVAQLLARDLFMGRVMIPMGAGNQYARRHAAILALRSEGKSIAQIARALGVTSRCVERRLAAARDAHNDQADLFD
jgi:DNA-binding NarL/FixJ family response regulator